MPIHVREIQSRSEPDRKHRVTYDPKMGDFSCTCGHWQNEGKYNRRECWHIGKAQEKGIISG